MNLTLNISVPDVNKVLTALGRQPYDDVAPLIAEIIKQSTEQLQAAQPKPEQPEPLPAAAE